MRSLALAAMLLLALAPAAVAKQQCRTIHGKLAGCPGSPISLRHPICVNSKPCGNICIARYKICRS